MNASGTNAYRYGPMKQWITSLTLVLADGTMLKTRNRPRKSSAGYNLASLVVGSEGTLALVTEAVLKLTTLPQNIHVGVATFELTKRAVDAAIRIMRLGFQLEALEFCDRSTMHAINHSGLSSLNWDAVPTLFFKVAGSSKDTVAANIDDISKVCREQGSISVDVAADPGRVAAIWGARKAVARALIMMKKEESDLFVHVDAAVPVTGIAALVGEMERLVEEEGRGKGWFGSCAGHVGDGELDSLSSSFFAPSSMSNPASLGALHTSLICPASSFSAAEELLRKIQRRALELDGTITGEHGIGLKLRDLLVEEVGQEGVDLMRKIKLSLDPRGILNPDKVVRIEEEALKYRL